MITLRCQAGVYHGGKLEGQWHLTGQLTSLTGLIAGLHIFRVQHHGAAKFCAGNVIEFIEVLRVAGQAFQFEQHMDKGAAVFEGIDAVLYGLVYRVFGQ